MKQLISLNYILSSSYYSLPRSVRCYGRVGCTTNKNSCNGFYSLTPSDGYSDSSGSSSNNAGDNSYGYKYNDGYYYQYGNGGGNDDGYDDDGIDADVYSKAEEISQSIYRQVSSSSSADEILMHYLLIAFVVVFSAFGISLTIRGFVKMQEMRRKKQGLTEHDNSYHGVHA